jgi:hypothetical protein
MSKSNNVNLFSFCIEMFLPGIIMNDYASKKIFPYETEMRDRIIKEERNNKLYKINKR